MAAATISSHTDVLATPFVVRKFTVSAMTNGQQEVVTLSQKSTPFKVDWTLKTQPTSGGLVCMEYKANTDATPSITIRFYTEAAQDITGATADVFVWYIDQALQDGTSITVS